MNFYLYMLLLAYSFGMAGGQILFKIAANHQRDADGLFLWKAITNVPLISALTLYATLTLLWVFILMKMPLSRAYPFVALSFVITPIAAAYRFDERLTTMYFIGLGLIIAGITIIVRYSK